MIERVIVVGGGHSARPLLVRLLDITAVTVIDRSSDLLSELKSTAHEGAVEDETGHLHTRHPLDTRAGDGTSRLVLEDARGAESSEVALVAMTGSDRSNIEICRLGKELGYRPVVGIVIDPAQEPAYQRVEAQTIVRATLLTDRIVRALRQDGVQVAHGLGLGRGDIIEVQILTSSPAIGQTLAMLEPDDWRVAAIYRNGELVLPTGQTMLEADDRVLLVGDPDILPQIAENLRVGAPSFPLRYGTRLVCYLPTGAEPQLQTEAEQLATSTRARALVHLRPDADNARLSVRQLVSGPLHSIPPTTGRPIRDVALTESSLEEHVTAIRRLDPGVVLLSLPPRTWTDRLFASGGRLAFLCNSIDAPVVISKGTPHYRRIVLLASVGGPSAVELADAAIDLARMLEIPLVILRVHVPRYLGGDRDAVEKVIATADRRARLYRIVPTIETHEGNPISRVAATVQDSDLLIVGRAKGMRDSFASPDVPLRIARAVRCSTLVLTD